MSSLVVAIGVNNEAYREILGICEGAKEDEAGWSAFLKHLKKPGLAGVRLIISDACLGLCESAADFFPEATWQRCIVHWYRNIFSHVPATKVREIAAMLKAHSDGLFARCHNVLAGGMDRDLGLAQVVAGFETRHSSCQMPGIPSSR